MADPFDRLSRQRFATNLRPAAIIVPNRASFPRTLPPVDPALAAEREGQPFPNVYDPPVAAPPPAPPLQTATGVANGREVGTYQARCADVGTILNPTAIFSTSRSWRGIEVFIQTDYLSGLNTGFLTVQIFAVVRNVGRVLVATGRTRGTQIAGVQINGATRICAAQAACDSFDVVVSRTGSPTIQAQTVAITCVAKDDVDTQQYDHYAHTGGGIITPDPALTLRTVPLLGVVDSGIVPLELVSLTATNGGAITRYLQVFDQAVAVVAGDRAIYSFAIDAGKSIYVDALSLRQRRFGAGIFGVGPSDAPIVYQAPAAADVGYNFSFR